MATDNPLPAVELFEEIILTKSAAIQQETHDLAQAIQAVGEKELALRFLELAIENQNLMAIYRTMMIAWLKATREA